MFSLRVICSHFQRKCNLLVHRTFISSNPNVNIILGLAPIIGLPSVSAQDELKDNESKTVKHNETKPENSSSEKPKESDNDLVDENGWDRLCAVFQRDEFGNHSKELTASIQGTCMACFIGLIYGGVNHSRTAFTDFIERNQATIFENHIDAKRKLQNHVTIHFAKGAFRWAWRMSLFTGGFMLFLSCVQAYKGRRSVLDYAVSGAVVGALLRVQLGPPGIVIGGSLGGILGLLCGLSTHALLSLTGTSLDEVISFQYELDQSRLNAYKQAEAKSFEKTYISEEGRALIANRPLVNDEKPL
uniref:Complex I assembly factor TIMMDC1, mitochondrial n=1 Tax=Graphocephala atropunctata TaxID=36148 RepID=A0A1B6KWM2_9HEMI